MLHVPIKLQIPVEQVIYVDEPFSEKCRITLWKLILKGIFFKIIMSLILLP